MNPNVVALKIRDSSKNRTDHFSDTYLDWQESSIRIDDARYTTYSVQLGVVNIAVRQQTPRDKKNGTWWVHISIGEELLGLYSLYGRDVALAQAAELAQKTLLKLANRIGDVAYSKEKYTQVDYAAERAKPKAGFPQDYVYYRDREGIMPETPDNPPQNGEYESASTGNAKGGEDSDLTYLCSVRNYLEMRKSLTYNLRENKVEEPIHIGFNRATNQFIICRDGDVFEDERTKNNGEYLELLSIWSHGIWHEQPFEFTSDIFETDQSGNLVASAGVELTHMEITATQFGKNWKFAVVNPLENKPE